jgi:glutathione synthase/RimK-type ligase-like ATP-grasp enzyme
LAVRVAESFQKHGHEVRVMNFAQLRLCGKGGTICGSRGLGVRRVHVGDEHHSPPESVSLYQRDLSCTSFDIRVFTVGYRTVAAMKHVSSSLAANVSREGKPERLDLSERLADLAERASRATGAEIAGTDMVIDRKGEPYVLEVNAQPDFIGLETVTDADIPSEISEYVVRRAEEGRIA